ncbi:MAG: MarR family transcriptional regulator [Clostridia bacterium]|nr:MarR family transcriptional regulator [Clostridia bacterium]
MKHNNTGFYIKRISDYIETDANRALEQYGITFSQARVLSFLIKSQDKVIIQKDIEEFLELKHPTVIGILQRMEAKGIIVSSVDQQDKRQKIITLTDAAFELEKRIADHVEDAEQRMAEGMTKEELDEIKRLLYKVYKNISK